MRYGERVFRYAILSAFILAAPRRISVVEQKLTCDTQRRNLLRMLTSTLLMGLPQVIPIIQAKMGSAKPVASDGMHGMHGMEGMGMGMKHSCH